MDEAGLIVESGVYSGAWPPSNAARGRAEWLSLSQAVKGRIDDASLERAKAAWDAALAEGTLYFTIQ
jgi:hypothetical protein